MRNVFTVLLAAGAVASTVCGPSASRSDDERLTKAEYVAELGAATRRL